MKRALKATLLRSGAISILALSVVGCSTPARIISVPRERVTTTAKQTSLISQLSTNGSAPDACLGILLDAANTARLELAQQPDNVIALSDYNFAVARIVDTIDNAKLNIWGASLSCGHHSSGTWNLQAKTTNVSNEKLLSRFRFVAADRLRFEGKLVGSRTIKQGIGAPVVAAAENLDFEGARRLGLENNIYYGLTAVVHFNGRNCVLKFVDPLEDETTEFDGRELPLRADFQAPLALSLVEGDPTRDRLGGLFTPAKNIESAQLTRLQPYNKDKIPVVFVHGLGDTTSIWMPMIDFLRSDESIRERYQFWTFRYPTGLPYPHSAAILRRQLNEFRTAYSDHKDIVLVGHSMGSMICRLVVSDSSMILWDALYSARPEEMDIAAEELEALKSALIFKPQPHISRVIFASASHRGADLAENFLGKLGAALIGDPGVDIYTSKQALSYLRPEVLPKGRKNLPNSVEVLRPDSTILLAADTLSYPPDLKYNSLIGDRGIGGHLDRTPPCSSDGIVPYWSAHLAGAESELVIPSEHWSILHPLGMAEVKRILLKHRDL